MRHTRPKHVRPGRHRTATPLDPDARVRADWPVCEHGKRRAWVPGDVLYPPACVDCADMLTTWRGRGENRDRECRSNYLRESRAQFGAAKPGPWSLAPYLRHRTVGPRRVLRLDGDAAWVESPTTGNPIRVAHRELAPYGACRGRWTPVWHADGPADEEGVTEGPVTKNTNSTSLTDAASGDESPASDFHADGSTVDHASPTKERQSGEHVVSSESVPESAPLSDEGAGPAVFTDETEADYHEREYGVASASLLKLMDARTPAHVKAWYDGHDAEETPALRFGRAVHCAVLEPDRYNEAYVVAPKFDRRTKAGKAAAAAFAAEHGHKVAITQSDHDTIEGMRQAIEAHPIARALLTAPDAQTEVTARWTDQYTGLRCKLRADLWIPSRRLCVDLKTAKDASPQGFARSVASYGYDVQQAHYEQGLGAAAFLFVVVEKEPPYAVGVYRMDEQSAARGHELWRGALDELARCVERDEWPGYGSGITELTLPRWRLGSYE